MSFGLQEGSIFAGRYQVLGCIAAGGMGAVYEVLHLETERRRALKVMLPQLLHSAELRDRFKREAKVAAKVESEFIVDVFDAGVDDATQMPFLVMELLRGEELGKRLQRQGRFPPGEVVTYLHQTALALDKTHQASIVHRDLKPDNLFLTARDDGQPRIKVLDFGVAKVIAESATVAGGTRSLGTPLYMSPEQFHEEVRLTGAVDIYALGMMAYTLLVGVPYWDHEAQKANNVLAFAMTAIRGPREPATARAALRGVMLPPAFDAWFARITAHDPAARYPTATGAIAALAEALGLPVSPASFKIQSSGVVPAGPAPSGSRTELLFTPAASAPLGSWVPGGAPTPAGATMTGAQPERSRGPVVAVVLALGVLGLGGAAFVVLRSAKATPATPVIADAPPVVAAPASAAAAAALSVAPVTSPPTNPLPPSASSVTPPAPVGSAATEVQAPVAKPSATPAANAKIPSTKAVAPAAKKVPKLSYTQD